MSQTPMSTLGLIGTFAKLNAIDHFAPGAKAIVEYFNSHWGDHYALVCQIVLGKKLTYYKDETHNGIRKIVVGDQNAPMATITDCGTDLKGPVLTIIKREFLSPLGLHHIFITVLPIDEKSKPIAGLLYLEDVWSAGCAQNGSCISFSRQSNMYHNERAMLEKGVFYSFYGTIQGFTFAFLRSFAMVEDPSIILPGWVDPDVVVTPFGVSDKTEDVYPIPGYALKEKAEWMDVEMYAVLSALFTDGAKTFNEIHHLRTVTATGAKFFKIKYLEKLVKDGVLAMEYYCGHKYFSPSIKLLMAMKQ